MAGKKVTDVDEKFFSGSTAELIAIRSIKRFRLEEELPTDFPQMRFNRYSAIFFVTVAWIWLAPVAAAQDAATPPATPEDAISYRQLVSWSSLQEPRPIPQPAPQPDPAEPRPAPDQQAKPPADPNQQQSPAQSFTGKILKDGDHYVLKTAGDNTYQLDEQSGLEQYENQQVKVVGSLDAGGKVIHVAKIELFS